MTRPPPPPRLSRRRFIAAAGAGAALVSMPRRADAAATEMRQEISRHGVTFRFAEPRPVGRYATGDWFVVAPVTIVEMTPASEDTRSDRWVYRRERGESRAIHGAQLDWHSEDRRMQGLDGIVWRGKWDRFDPSANVDPGFTGRPLHLDRPVTVIKAVSLPEDQVGTHMRPCLSDIVFLTVVDVAPPEGAFRPPAEPGNKRARWREADLDWSILPDLPRPAGVEVVWDFEALAARHERPEWNSHSRFDFNRPMMAANNQPSYGREHAWETGYALLALCTDAPRARRRDLFVGLVQQGLDVAAMVQGGRAIKAADGNSIGRAAPMVLAAAALDDPWLRQAASGRSFTASEHGQFFHVGRIDVETPREKPDRPRAPYTEDMIGVPEFGGQQLRPRTGTPMQVERSGSHYRMDYRDIVSNPLVPAAAAMHAIRGGVETWDQPAFFDYMDRWTAITRTKTRGGTRRAKQSNQPSTVALGYYAAWRDLSGRPRHLSPPEPMVREFDVKALGLWIGLGVPLMRPIVGGFEIQPMPSNHRDNSLDAESRVEMRISEDGARWRDAGSAPFGTGMRIDGLPRGSRVFVQLRMVHPRHGAGPWNFDWMWWRQDMIWEGRLSYDGLRWEPGGRFEKAEDMLAWLSRTWRREAPRVELRRNRPRKKGEFTDWTFPPWLHAELPFEPPAAGRDRLRRNTAYAPSVVTL